MLAAPLFLAVFYFAIDNEIGISLAERISKIRILLTGNFLAQQFFESCLLDLGVMDIGMSWDSERFLLKDKQIFKVTSEFPVLAASSLPKGITDVRYTIDPSTLTDFAIALSEVLHITGAI